MLDQTEKVSSFVSHHRSVVSRLCPSCKQRTQEKKKSTQWVCPTNASAKKQHAQHHLRHHDPSPLSNPHRALPLPLRLLLPLPHQTRLAHLVGGDPLALDGPGADALVRGVVAREVAVLDQAAARVAAREVDDFELCVARAGQSGGWRCWSRGGRRGGW